MAACAKEHPILNFHDQFVGHNMTKNQVRSCIFSAGKARKWQMKEIKPGLIRGRTNVRGHIASIDINYSDKNYSIDYKSSENLLAKGGSIHRNYNRWVNLLNNGIQSCIRAQ